MKNAGFVVPAIVAAILAILDCEVPSDKNARTYSVGETGPAGGLVFYDQGSTVGGWRYMEVAPGDLASAVWWNGSAIATGATGVLEGTGENNTQLIVSAQGAGTYAASLCSSHILNSFHDWYLPSQEEVAQIWSNLTSESVGTVSGSYWTSTDYLPDATKAIYGSVSHGGVSFMATSKATPLKVRPVRAF